MVIKSEKSSNPNPFKKANYLSRIFFWWLNDIILYGRKHDNVPKDLYGAMPEDLSESLTYKLESPVHPELLYQIIIYFHSPSPVTPLWAYLNATAFITLTMLRAVLISHTHFRLGRLGMQARIACSSLIYRKLIRLPPSAGQKTSNPVISLLSVDVAKFDCFFVFAPFIIVVPIVVLVIAWLICQYVGLFAATIGVTLLILQTFLIQVACSNMMLKFRAKQTTRTDYRISLISEIITGIRAVKMYVWENFLEKLVFSARGLEIANHIKISYLSSLVSSFSVICYRVCIFAVIMVYLLPGRKITADEIIPVTQHFSNMKTCINIYFFFGLMSLIDMSVSMKRIETFLLQEEVKLNAEDIDVDDDKVISMENVTAYSDDKSAVLKNISLDVSAKNLYVIVGSIGSGKSSMLRLMLGELQTAFKVFVRGKVSYASQEPWLFNGSIKDNILFGEIYDAEKYEKVIDACALMDDFRQLSYGDQTLVGERGSNLSGGQRARVNLARAAYREADIYLLDDPLSAVDAAVGTKIMQDCINGLLKDKTRILVTHSVQQLEGITEIILLEKGEVKFKGNVKEFRQNNHFMARLMIDDTEVSIESPKKLQANMVESDKKANNNVDEEPKETEELIAKGTMKTSIYSNYAKAGGWNLLFLVILTNALFIISASVFDLGLGSWTNKRKTLLRNETVKNPITSIGGFGGLNSLYKEKIIFVLGGLIISTILTSISRHLLLSKFALNASRNLHNNIFSRLIRTTLGFFNANSTGKILNRFSEDIGILDNALPQALAMSVNPIFQVIAVLLTIIMANWWVSIPSSICIFMTLLSGKLYVRTIQGIKRIAGSARSPILSFAASSLEGVTTIRACKAEHIVAKDFDTRQDQRTSAEFLIIALSQAFSLWVELIFTGFLASMTYLFIIKRDDDNYGGVVGLTLLQILIVTEIVPFEVVKCSEVFAHMINVERMLQFKELEQENMIEDEPELDVPKLWPNKGEITFERLYLRYSDDSEPALWNINCRIESGTKVGIVGRTGAGKSSLISALFRFAKIDGSIVIDGVDIKKIDVYKLRSKISVIPQEPILFQTSLRKNLDPLDKFSDAALYSALESVQLKEVLKSLDFPIERIGSNLSVGQRQLLCLARAIINKNKILVLDEATANVDSLTDAVIQKIIRMEFKECTVLTIAHRLNTVMDSEKIMVMDNGRLVEYDHPFLLLQSKESYLFKMVKDRGEVMVKHFTDVTKQAYEETIHT